MTQAKLFHDFITAVWDDRICDNDGTNSQYKTYKDANVTAATMGAKPTDTNDGPDEDNAVEWQFPDGSTAMIQRNGSGLR